MSNRLSLGEMIVEVAEFINDKSPDTASIIQKKINQQYLRIADDNRWDDLISIIDEKLTTIDGQIYLAMPADAAEVLTFQIRDTTFPMIRESLTHLLDDTRIQSVNPPVLYSVLGYRATRQPIAPSGPGAQRISVLTESVMDKDIDVHFKGLRDNPEIEQTEIVMTHETTPDTLPVQGLIDWRAGWSLDVISVASGLNGFIQITDVSPDTILAHISNRRRASRYLIIRLQNAPSADSPVQISYRKKVTELVEADESPVIPASEAIIEATIAQMRRYTQEYSQAREHESISKRLVDSSMEGTGGRRIGVEASRVDRSRRARLRGF